MLVRSYDWGVKWFVHDGTDQLATGVATSIERGKTIASAVAEMIVNGGK